MIQIVLGWPIGDAWDRTYRTGSSTCKHIFDPSYKFCPTCGRRNYQKQIETGKTLKKGFTIHNNQLKYHDYTVDMYPTDNMYWLIEDRYIVPPYKHMGLVDGDRNVRGQVEQIPDSMLQVNFDHAMQYADSDGHTWDTSKIGLYTWTDNIDITMERSM